MIRCPCCQEVDNCYVGGSDDMEGTKRQATVAPIRIQKF